MRGNIVVPDNIDAVTEFSSGMASMCEVTTPQRYLKARSKGGLTIAEAIAGIHHQNEWCIAALTGSVLKPTKTFCLPQKGLTGLVTKSCQRLDRVLKKYRSAAALTRFLALPDPEFDGQIALRAGTVIDTTVVVHQVYQCHLRRAFYTFDRDSGFMFPGGSAEYLKIYENSVLSTLFPIYAGRKKR